MSVFKLDTTTGDRAIENNNFVIISEAEEVRQRVETRLRTYQGEWFLDITLGVPYYQEVFEKNIPLSQIEAVFKDAIINTPGVTELVEFELDYTNSNRNLLITFEAKAGDETIEGSEVI